MHILRTVLSEFSELRERVFALSEEMAKNPLQQGLLLDVNPFWWTAHCLSAAGFELQNQALFEWQSFGWGPLSIFPNTVPAPTVGDFFRKYEKAVSLTDWIFGQRPFNNSPFLLKIISRIGLPEIKEGAREELIRIAQNAPLPTYIESRTEAQLIAGPGDQVVSPRGAAGTLGGFLRDQHSGRIFAATCGHVIEAGMAMSNTGALGPCIYAKPPVTLAPGEVCYAKCPSKAKQDIALIDVSQQTVINTCNSVVPYVYSHQNVQMRGASSGLRAYEVGGTMLTHEVGGACWDNVFELRLPTHPSILHPNLALLMNSPPQSGDSGSWVTDGTEWCGVVTAADNLCGYALESDAVLSNANADWGLNLSLA